MGQGKRTKKQHYVPQFYLEKFTSDGNVLFVYDKILKKSFQKNKKDVAEENYFYDLPTIDSQFLQAELSERIKKDDFFSENSDKIREILLDEQFVEHSLSRLEAGFAQFFDAVLHRVQIEKIKRIFKDEHKKQFALFLAFQDTRTKEFRETQIQIEEGVANDLMKSEYPQYANDYRIQVNPEMVALNHASFMFNPHYQNRVVEVLSQHIWLVGVNNTSQPLYTSDHPIVRIAHQEDPNGEISYEGLASEGVQIVFPLTPKYLLLIFERSFHKTKEATESRHTFLTEKEVKFYNSYQLARSHRQIYCPANKFDLVEELLTENPELFSEQKPRVEINSTPDLMHIRSSLGKWKPKL